MTTRPAEAWDKGDDWTAEPDSYQRRKLQNRLNQRAYRKRRHLQRLAANDSTQSEALGDPQAGANGAASLPTPTSIVETPRQTTNKPLQHLLTTINTLPISVLIKDPVLRERVADFLLAAYANWSLGLPRPSDLSSVTRLNAFNALATNAMILHIPVEFLESDDFNSPFNLYSPERPDASRAYPTDLCPTALQTAVVHHSWLDLFPLPGLRDNILRGIQTGEYDEDELCQELCCDLLDLGADSSAQVIVWGDAWDAKGWEFSDRFFHKWATLLQGCPEVFESTNFWRGKRGAKKISYF